MYLNMHATWNHSIGQLGLLQPIILSFASLLWHIAIASHFSYTCVCSSSAADEFVLLLFDLSTISGRIGKRFVPSFVTVLNLRDIDQLKKIKN